MQETPKMSPGWFPPLGLPAARVIALLVNPTNPLTEQILNGLQAAARSPLTCRFSTATRGYE